MDISKYRTRFPPKEHEEAVRMLLEGLDKPLVQRGTSIRSSDLREQHASDHSQDNIATNMTRHYAEDDRLNDRNGNNNSRGVNRKASMNRNNYHEQQPSLSSSSVDSGSLARFHPNDDDLEAGQEDFDRPRLHHNNNLNSNNDNNRHHNHHNDNNQKYIERHDKHDDELEFNSESSSQDHIQVSPLIARNRFSASNKLINKRLMEQRELANNVPVKMRSKATSTTSDSISTASGHHLDGGLDTGDLNENYEVIPNRTIAVQCDLKLSSVKRDGLLLDSASSDLASMQASSISSTRYGFYKLCPETLEQRRRLARSISSRNIAHQQESSSEDGPLAQAASLNRSDVPINSSLSSAHSCSSLAARSNHRSGLENNDEIRSDYDAEFFRELQLARSRKFNDAPFRNSPQNVESQRPRRRPSSTNGNDDECESDDEVNLQKLESERQRASAAKDTARNKLEQRLFKQHQQVSSSAPRNRALDSLPRRPKTALSYVSTSRLRGQRNGDTDTMASDRSLSDVDLDEESKTSLRRQMDLPSSPDVRQMRERAMSQQVLYTANTNKSPIRGAEGNRSETKTTRQFTLDEGDPANNSDSDSDLDAAEKYRVPCQEELLVTRRGKSLSAARGAHQYTGSTGQLSRRSNTLIGGISDESYQYKRAPAATNPRRGDTLTSGTRKPVAAGKLSESQLSPSYEEKIRVGTTVPANKLAASGIYQKSEDENSDKGPKLTRFSSMSLSRGQRPVSADRNCTLNNDQIRRKLMTNGGTIRWRNPTTTTGHSSVPSDPSDFQAADSDQNHHQRRYLSRLAPTTGSRRSTLTRKDRSCSQQTLATGSRNANDRATPLGAANSIPERNANPSSEDRRSDQLSGRTASGGSISRSTSMKQMSKSGQNEARLLSSLAPNRVRQAAALEHRRRHHESSSVDCDHPACCDQQSPMGSVAVDDKLYDDTYQDCRAPPVWSTRETSGQRASMGSASEDDSESPLTRTWANPASTTKLGSNRKASAAAANQQHSDDSIPDGRVVDDRVPLSELERRQTAASYDVPTARRAARSQSMRNVANRSGYEQPMSGYNGTSGQYHMDPLMAPNNGVKSRAHERFENIYRAGQEDDLRYQSEGTSEDPYSASSLDEESKLQHRRQVELLNNQRAPAQHQQLDFNSQQLLNEIGLPEVNTQPPVTGSSRSHLGAPSRLSLAPGFTAMSRHATTGRRQAASGRDYLPLHQHLPQGPAITGRAMSHQSLSRPTMPLSRRLRRSAAGGGGTSGGSQSGAGSDVGGSSMSLVSRLRYENAHTRTPVVMYIPQAVSKSASSEHIKRPLTRGNTLLSGRSIRRQSPSSKLSKDSGSVSQDRTNRKSLSRNGSDSESSSSMLRTLVKPKSRLASSSGGSGLGLRAHGASGRRRYVNGTLKRDSLEDEENMDGVGQLASEIDSYKFRRRYSVPKNAKINWFSKLKQRVTSSKS